MVNIAVKVQFLKAELAVAELTRCPVLSGMHHLTYLQPVRLPKADADAGSKGPSRNTADHDRHALPTGVIALQLYLSAQFAVREVGFVTGTVDRETPVVLLAALGQQSKKTYYNNAVSLFYSWQNISLKKLQNKNFD